MTHILLVAPSFYPFPQVASVRMTNWARILGRAGWRVSVVCRDYGHRAAQASIDRVVHPGVVVHQLDGRGLAVPTPAEDIRPANTGQVATRYAGKGPLLDLARLAFVPDPQIRFWRRALPTIRRLIETESVDLLLTSSPQHSVHGVGVRLERWLRERGVKWVADYRDPHLIDIRFQPTGLLRVHWPLLRRFEASVYRHADLIIHAIPDQERWARLAYPLARGKCVSLRHPLPEDLASGRVVPHDRGGVGRDLVLTIGTFDHAAAEVVAESIGRLNDEGADLAFAMVGVKPPNAERLRAMLGERLILTGPVSHDIAKSWIASARVLVNAVSPARQRAMLISSKLFEFAATDAAIISLNPTRPDTHLLREVPNATVLDRPNVETFLEALRNAVAHAPTEEDRRRAANFRARYGESAHAKRLLDLLTPLAERGSVADAPVGAVRVG